MSNFGLKKKIKFEIRRRGEKAVQEGIATSASPGKIPHVTRLMALAIRLDQLLREGHVADQAELARLGHVTRARVTQIMGLLNLAPDIQEALLFLPRTEKGRDPITEMDLRPIVAVPDWRTQRAMWCTV